MLPILSEVPGTLYSIFSTPFVTPVVAGATGIFTLTHLSPNMLTTISDKIVDKFHNCSKFFWPTTAFKELEEMENILEEIDNNNNPLTIPANQSTTSVVFVKKVDRDKINNGSLIAELDFE